MVLGKAALILASTRDGTGSTSFLWIEIWTIEPSLSAVEGKTPSFLTRVRDSSAILWRSDLCACRPTTEATRPSSTNRLRGRSSRAFQVRIFLTEASIRASGIRPDFTASTRPRIVADGIGRLEDGVVAGFDGQDAGFDRAEPLDDLFVPHVVGRQDSR